MSLQVTIYDTSIPDSDIIQYGKSEISVDFNGAALIAATMDIVLNDLDKTAYNPLYTGSLFFGVAWYNKWVTIYDNDAGHYMWKGRIKNVESDWGRNELKVTTTNFVQDMIDAVCEYSNDSDKTGAEIIYELLTEHLEIDETYIKYSGFQNAINIQDDNSAYLTVEIEKSDNKSIKSVIEKICRLTVCEFYDDNNIIHIDQYADWNGILGEPIKHKDIQPNTFRFYSDDTYIYNEYKIAYDSGGSIAYVEDEDSTSQSAYGITRPFLEPDEKTDAASSSDLLIIYRNSTGATWAGDLVLSKFKNTKYFCDFYLVNKNKRFSYLPVNTQLDLDFYEPFIREPVRIKSRIHDRDAESVFVKAEFLNLPVNKYSRDTTPPSPPEIICAIPNEDGTVILRWTKNPETDHVGYLLYFTVSPGEWESEFSDLGMSPVDIKNPSMSPDGYCYTEISELSNNTRYFFKMRSYDTSYNESVFSNTVSCVPRDEDDNIYRLTGNIITGLTLDITNPTAGTVPDDFTTYADLDDPGPYDDITAVYVSPILYSDRGFTYLTYMGAGDPGDIQMQYRTSTDGTTWSAWSTKQNAIGLGSITPAGAKYFQYRAVFYSSYYTDSDKFYVKSLEEAS